MADFTLLRYQECNNTLVGKLKANRQWCLLWVSAVLILLFRLGTGAISGSEGRWLAVSREMLMTGDWLHPTINGAPYFDKPLVSYWLINIVSFFNQREVTEFTARLPSALAALLAMGAVIDLTKRLFSERAALIAGWLSITLYSFLFWGRLAEADMENAAFIIAAIVWYIRCCDKKSFADYFIFWLLCAIGAQTKGLAAFAIPVASAGLDMLFGKRLKFHLNGKSLLGFLAGIVVYAIPFLCESFSRGSYGANGIVLVFRENIMRVFNPWDHKNEPFWCYFIFLPRLLLPWTPIFFLALISDLRRLFKRECSTDEKWLLATIGIIFLLFTISRSRRVYYILPIVPFCVILCSKFLADTQKDIMEMRITRILLTVLDRLIPVFCAGCLAVPFLFRMIAPQFLPETLRAPQKFIGIFYFLIPAVGLVLFAVWMILFLGERKRKDHESGLIAALPCMDRLIAAIFIGMFTVVTVILPYIASDPLLRSGKDFFGSINRSLFKEYRIPPKNVAFFGSELSHCVYYLNLPEKASLFNVIKMDQKTRSFTADTMDYGGLSEFIAFLAKIDQEGGAVIGRFDFFEHPALPEEIRHRFVMDPLTPATSVLCEPDTLTDRKVREEMLKDLAAGKSPEKSRACRSFRKILRKKIIVLIVPPPQKTE